MKNSAACLIAAASLHRRSKTSGFLLKLATNFVACLAAALPLPAAGSAGAQSQPPRNESESELFELLNHERSASNLPELKWDDALFKAARQHALLMLNLNDIAHQFPEEPDLAARLTEAGARFNAIAENIAIGANAKTIHAGWMDSPGHRANILDGRYSSVGIAVVRGKDGLFAVEDFAHEIADLTLEQQEEKISALLAAMNIRLRDATEDARKTCDAPKLARSSPVKWMVWFETPDLSKLPEEVERKIRARHYSKAAIGACRAGGSTGFAQYRIAILFF